MSIVEPRPTAASYSSLEEAIKHLEIAMPVPDESMTQDEEWVVVRQGDEWQQIRLHDYNEVFAIPGLYEKWVYEVFGCKSPDKIRDLLGAAFNDHAVDPSTITVLDLGAGNGCVAEALLPLKITSFVGVDIAPAAETAAHRDRPGLYADFVIDNLASPTREAIEKLDSHEFNCLTCVAALGFGDIPPEVFSAAYNRIADGGWIAFTIKPDFLTEADPSGFSRLMKRMMENDILDVSQREKYLHRIATHGEKLYYEAFIGRKKADIPADWV